MIFRNAFPALVLALVAAGCRPATAEDTAPAGARMPAGDSTPAAPAEAGPDSVRLLSDLRVLAADSMEGRATGTPGSARARAFLLRRLAESGAEPVGGHWEHPFTWDGGSGVNLVGRLEGSGTSTIVLTAHYDHLGTQDGLVFNGADDNASGTVAVLEIVRVLAASPLRSQVIVALFDAEEAGLQGSRAFVADPGLSLDEDVLEVNLDMVARTGGVLWASGASHTPALRPVLERVAATAPLALRLGHDRPGAPEGDDWTGASDHGPFHDAGIPFVYFGVEDHPDYHQASDDVERVDPGEFVDSVRTILAAIRALDAALPLHDDEGRP